MKRILQAMDGVATKPVAGANDMTKFLSIVDKNNVEILNEASNPHKVSLPVQMAMQHYQKEEPVHKPVGRDSVIRKYFKEVEEELTAEKTERRQLINQYASVIAERVLMKESLDEACWDKYKQVGMKKKGRKMVPNCVPKESTVNEVSTTEKQARTMAAAAHNPKFAKKVGIKQSVAKEFNQKDKGTALLSNAMKKKKNVKENEIPGHSMGFTGGVGPGMINNVIDEMPIDFNKENPIQSQIHHKSNPGSIEYRIMRARSQIKDLATRVDSNELIVWEGIARQFPELAMNIEEIRHGIEELAKIRKGGGRRSHNIDKHIGEAVMPAIKASKPSTPKIVKPKAKTSVCRAGQTQTGTQIKNGVSVPKCSVTTVKKKVVEANGAPVPGQGSQSSLLPREPGEDVFNSKENIIPGVPYTMGDLAFDAGIIVVSTVAGAFGGPAGEAAAMAANASKVKRIASLLRAGVKKLNLMDYQKTGSMLKYLGDVVKSLPIGIPTTITGSVVFNTMIGILDKATENDYPGLTGKQAARNMRNVVRYSDTPGNPSPLLHPERYK